MGVISPALPLWKKKKQKGFEYNVKKNVAVWYYIKVKTIASGIMKISENAAAFKIFVAWNSTNEIRKRAPHHEFCPINCK